MAAMKFMTFTPSDGKYLVAYIAPLAAGLGMALGGWWSPGALYVAFVAIPLVERFSAGSPANLPESGEDQRSQRRFFDLLLYLNVPILYGLLAYYGYLAAQGGRSLPEMVATVLNMGLIIGVCGINVGHELGHRADRLSRLAAWTLLLPAFYLHFYIEHNRGHHRWVATEKDPASARRGEMVYHFWWRSISGGWRHAWQLEADRLHNAGLPALHPHNLMLSFQIAQGLWLLLWYLLLGPLGVALSLGAGLVGVLLLESINYIEHYGLRRQRLAGGQYEPVSPRHSWNSNHHLGRIFLYELTRHADHHYKASRKYQILRHFEESPQLPTGYPGAILLALVPPLWFARMDSAVDQWNQRTTPHPLSSGGTE